MTAIITYWNPKARNLIIACDNIARTEDGHRLTDKGWLFYNRYFIAAYGPNMLPHALNLLKTMDFFSIPTSPQTIREFIKSIDLIYQVLIPEYRAKASPEYQKKGKGQGAVVFDQDTEKLWFIHFGYPFNADIRQSEPIPVLCEHGIERFGIYESVSFSSEFDEDSFISSPRDFIKKEFEELDDYLSNFAQPENKVRDRIGSIGTYYEYKEGTASIRSAFESIDAFGRNLLDA